MIVFKNLRSKIRWKYYKKFYKEEEVDKEELENMEEIEKNDEVYEYQSSDGTAFRVVCDPKSLLYIYGMQLDFSTELIGGGFNFTNPNATQTCGCGSSFAV